MILMANLLHQFKVSRKTLLNKLLNLRNRKDQKRNERLLLLTKLLKLKKTKLKRRPR